MTNTQTVDIPKGVEIKIGDGVVHRFTISPLGFVGYAETAMEALDRSSTKIEATLMRMRLLRQCAPRTSAGAVLAWEESDVVKLPIGTARALLDAVRASAPHRHPPSRHPPPPRSQRPVQPARHPF